MKASGDETIAQRLALLRRELEKRSCDAFFSLSPATNQYLSGFTGSTSAVLVTQGDARFFCDFRYTEQAGEQVSQFEVEEKKGDLNKAVGEALGALGVGIAAFEPQSLNVAQWEAVGAAFGGQLQGERSIIACLRVRKTPEEVACIRAASELSERVLAKLLAHISAHADEPECVSERELGALYEYEVKRAGAEGASFDPIALFGAHSSLPHGQPGDGPLKRGDIVLFDVGCRKAGYCSDLTRTYVFGTIPGAWFTEIYEITLAAQQAGLAAVRPGVMCSAVDAAARDLINDAGYGEHFGHGLGHGVGIEVHEGPRLNMESDDTLEAGMVITVEPGIYLPERGGVRIEDLVLVTEDGCDVLTRTPKELEILAG